MQATLKITMAAVVLTLASASHVQAQMRFQGMDRNRDGVITREEWRGSDGAFRNWDWNGDGVLSGDELRPGARRQTASNQDWNRDGIVDRQDALISQRFRGYDGNGDNRVAASEWPGSQLFFRRLDIDRNGYLTMTEYANGGGMTADSQGGPAYRFSNIDSNRDGWITRGEWRMSAAEFNRLDTNRDNRISNFEFQNSALGADNDRSERTRAYDAGHTRGLDEGYKAGREDHANGHGWDLDGQTELERADSGYYSQIGPLADYQSGYREGFRQAYRQGFDAR